MATAKDKENLQVVKAKLAEATSAREAAQEACDEIEDASTKEDAEALLEDFDDQEE